ncbi:MAG: adenosylmethionine--8-amino-7-oxononanoate transaminase [Legionellales bacterium RIFCSPHIGHO2_12_FULL_42_9]|nr:MAG: adenosylmethionine--8-amino-7-oxononanoate transaminase [Legionellales bacterium RIFCSPHIGHO2_12_FULL_42_9]
MTNSIIRKDLQHIWHPCTQMTDLERYPPLIIHKAKGSYLYTDQGVIIDGISSWWCKVLGHNHPGVIDAITKQLHNFEQVILANTTYAAIVELGESLSAIGKKQHVFFASDGSCSIEIALKLALHAKQIQGESQRNEFIALSNGYHGETLACLSVSDLGLYTKPYQGYGVKCNFLKNIQYSIGMNAPLLPMQINQWEHIFPQLEALKQQCCAIILEPLVQGAGGMLCYSAEFLTKLYAWARANQIYFIVDEIMTGIGRTGKWLASDYAHIDPDLICLSKGLTAGTIPLSCVLIDHKIFELFYNSAFLHSHTYSGNALAVAAAVAVLKIIQEEDLMTKARHLGVSMYREMLNVAKLTGELTNVRSFGAMVAADFTELKFHNSLLKHQFQQIAITYGVLLRPLGNTIYWLPPLNSDPAVIVKLAEATLQSILMFRNQYN